MRPRRSRRRASKAVFPPPAMTEVRYVRLTEANFGRLHPATLNLMRRQGDNRLTLKALRRYAGLQAKEAMAPGNLVLAALDGEGRVVGVAAALGWGHRLSLVAVHRRVRGRGLGGRLLRLAVQALGRYYAEVASDNLPSLRAFFACGLRAYDVFTRPSGKIILRLRTVDPPPLGSDSGTQPPGESPGPAESDPPGLPQVRLLVPTLPPDQHGSQQRQV